MGIGERNRARADRFARRKEERNGLAEITPSRTGVHGTIRGSNESEDNSSSFFNVFTSAAASAYAVPIVRRRLPKQIVPARTRLFASLVVIAGCGMFNFGFDTGTRLKLAATAFMRKEG